MFKIKAISNTLIKLRPLDSSELTEKEIQEFREGETFEANHLEWVRNEHVKAETQGNVFGDYRDLYLYKPHVEITEEKDNKSTLVLSKDDPYPTSFSIKLPFFSQLDNYFNPTGSCNVTSIAMCLFYLGVRPKGSYKQLEDELYNYMLDNALSRHSPHHLAKVVRDYGFKDYFTEHATIEDCKKHIYKKEMPTVIHGYFTTFGHIIAVKGFNEKGFIVNDPYGEWFPTGYRTDLSGEGLTYSYDMIRRLCIPDGSFWVHFIER